MRSSQRGSVLLAVIAGIVLLAVLGVAMVSLMTDSVMIGVDGKETVQATYLAESGKEIARTSTASLDGGPLMAQAQKLEAQDIAVGKAGKAKLQLFPSWFRWSGEALQTTDSGWYTNGENTPPSGERLWLAISQNGSRLYQGKLETGLFKDETKAADIYLVGRTSVIASPDGGSTLTVTPVDGTDDFAYFPEHGGLIGLVSKPENLPASVTVDKVRFTYDRMSYEEGQYVFKNVTALTDDEVSFENKNIALGQYFRVLSEGTTNNGAQAALVWHTNGRNSLRFSGTGNANITLDATGSLSASDNKTLDKEMQDLFGNNITNSSQGNNSGYTSSNGALMTQTLQASKKNHFLDALNGNKSSTDYWFAAISKAKTAFGSGNGGLVQIAVRPSCSESKELFAGTLFRVTTLKKETAGEDSNANRLGDGVAGLGMGIAYGEVTIEEQDSSAVVVASSINPALLPGFLWSSDSEFHTADSFSSYSALYSLTSEEKGKKRYTINPMAILWAYNDSETNPPQSLRWLAVSRLGSIPTSFSRIVTSVQEKDGSNRIRGWIAQNADLSAGIDWPSMDFASTQPEKSPFTRLKWDAVNSPYASLPDEAVYEVNGPFTVLTSFATGTGKYERTGFFEGVYSADEKAPPTTCRPLFRDFAAGTLAESGNSGAGLLPGFVQ